MNKIKTNCSLALFGGLLLGACSHLKLDQPMARFLSPRSDGYQFIGAADLIEQSVFPSETGGTTTYDNSKVTMTSLGAASEKVYGFVASSGAGGTVGLGLKHSLVENSGTTGFAMLVNGDLALGASNEKATNEKEPGMSLISANAGVSAGWKFNQYLLLYAGSAAQASTMTSKYFQKTGCIGTNCLGSDLKTETSWFSSNAIGGGVDVTMRFETPLTLTVKAANVQWVDSRTTSGREVLYQAFLTAKLK